MTADRVPAGALASLGEQAGVPRKNGELVFAAPWEGRAFGLVVALHERQLYDWEEFRGRLIAEIGRADVAGEPSSYYERWLAAFERLLVEKGLVAQAELDARSAALAASQADGESAHGG